MGNTYRYNNALLKNILHFNIVDDTGTIRKTGVNESNCFIKSILKKHR